MSSTVKRMAAVVSDSDGAWKGRGKQVYRDIKDWKNLKIDNLKLKTERAAMDEKDLSQFLQSRSPWTAALSAAR